jgi:hypothetical protein
LFTHVAKLRRQLNAGRTGTDDGDIENARRIWRVDGCQDSGQQTTVQLFRFAARIEKTAVLLGARRAEIIAHTADSNHQRVVAEPQARHDFMPRIVEKRSQQHLFLRAIEPVHLSVLIAIAMSAGMAEITELVLKRVQRARGNFMQQWLPQMCRT